MNLAIVAAAGRSSRFGRNKALLPFAGSCVLDALLDRLAAGGVERARVVAAAGDLPLAAHCAARRIDLAVNERPADGMLSSIRRGLAAAEIGPEDAVVICPVDFPAVSPSTVAALLAALRDPATELAVPVHAGRRGHPLALRGDLVAAVSSLDPAVGLRQILQLRPYREVAVDDPAIHLDLDSWRQFAVVEALARAS